MASEKLDKHLAKISWIDVNNPQFDKATKVHDWRNHVDEIFKITWTELTQREKLIIASIAEGLADIEQWE